MSAGSKRKASEVAEGVKVGPSAPTNVQNNSHCTVNNTTNNHNHPHIHERVIVKKQKLAAGIVDGVRTNDGHAPREWVCPEKKSPQTNVSHVGWQKNRSGEGGRWIVDKVDETGKNVYVGCGKTLAKACDLRRDVVDGKKGPGELVLDSATGEWKISKCGNCCKPYPLAAFAPAPCGNNARTYAAFVQAGDDLHSSDPDRVAAGKAKLAEAQTKNKKGDTALRTSKCRRCRAILHKSRTEGDSATAMCYRMAQKIRADMAERGCANCNEHRSESLEADHGERPGVEKCEHKDLCVTDRAAWASEYGDNGPEMMWREYQRRIEQILCKCCHLLESTHSGARGVDSKTLTEGSQKRHKRKYVEKKTAYNNKLKREHVNRPGDEPGSCFYCGKVCIEDRERAFQWMHNDQLTKGHTVSKLVANAQSFATAKPRIDGEVAVSRLGCASCHWCEETLPGMKVDQEKWDALEKRWASDSYPTYEDRPGSPSVAWNWKHEGDRFVERL